MKNPLVEQFGDQQRWVTWKMQERKGKKTKIPFDLFGSMASSTDKETWSTYHEVKMVSDNVGIVFTPEQNLLGIDIDHCIDESGNIPNEIQQFIVLADTYTEISPSKKGLHLFLKLKTPLTLIANRKGNFEAYTSGRYFTVTENSFGEIKSIREVTATSALSILQTIGYPWNKGDEQPSTNEQLPLTSAQKEEKTVDTKSEVKKTQSHSGPLSDEEVVDKMFSAKNGQKIKDLYFNSKSNSEDDLALCSHLAFYTRKDPHQMERIWLSSACGSRKKTKSRKDYRDRTIAAAIKSCKETYEPSSTAKTEKAIKDYDLNLLFTTLPQGGKIYTQNTENMCRILRKHPEFQGRFRYDKFKNSLEIFENSKWRIFEDNDQVNVQTEISILFPYFGRVGKEMIFDAMVKVAKENSIDSALDYVKNIRWDGIARVDNWLSTVYGCPKDSYHIAVGSNWLKGMVKRIVEAGCKFDYVLVLEGPQGSKKSTSLSVLVRGLHVETTMSTDTKDFFMQFVGNLIVEFSEGDTMNRTETKKMKAIITTQIDKYRPAYGRNIVEFPRRCVFAMTTNDEEYLKDETGNRRWLPVRMVREEADIEWIEANRDQLFAEAYHRIVNLNETVYEFPKDIVSDMQNSRRVHYEHEDEIVWWYAKHLKEEDREAGITVHQAYRDAINGGFNSKMLNKYDEMKIADVLKNTLKLQKIRVKIGSHRAWKWFKPSFNLDMSELIYKENEEDPNDY